ncbi:family 43 glycosylhydrolase [Trueperella sp. LYQ141]|uniref:family 43 glycosylhydrolase n=1 Tax=Trueperella sp. LYQ141 TaxID=3391058 RepID=UPI00398332A9
MSARFSRRFLATTAAFLLSGIGGVSVAAADSGQTPPAPTRSITSDGNPIIRDGSLYTADAAMLVDGDRLYIYAGRDSAAPDYGSFDMTEYVVMSTSDVAGGHWDIWEGNLRPAEVFSWASGKGAYAGQTVKGRDGKYYWYVPIESQDTSVPNRMAIGVAVSDSPVGPWRDAIGKPLLAWRDVFGDATNGQEIIDPHVLIDGDHTYLYWGSWYTARVVELAPDMVTRVGDIQTMTGLDSFFEAPWITKKGDTYYLLYDWKKGGSQCTPSNYQACIAYATSKNPRGPWTFQDVIVGGTSATTMHPALIEFKGHWYVTYQTKDAVNGGHFRRSVAIDEVTWNGDKINRVTPTRADDPAWRLTTNIAPDAREVAASFTEQPPMRLAALNDGRAPAALLPPDQWGNYRGVTNTVPSDWVLYSWDSAVTITGMGAMFHRDGNWIRPPASYTVDYLGTDGNWHPVALRSTPREVDTWNQIDFAEPVTAYALRMTLTGEAEGPYYHSVSISEWEVYAAPTGSPQLSPVVTKVGTPPPMPEGIRLGEQWRSVRWEKIDPASYAQPGQFTVRGRVLGYDTSYVTQDVTVTASGQQPDTPDTQAPTLALGTIVQASADGWYRTAVPMCALGNDDQDYALSYSGTVDAQPWVAQEPAHQHCVSITGDGTHTITAIARDRHGNTSSSVSQSVRIDTVAPTAEAQLRGRSAVVNAHDELSGVHSMMYRFDNGPWHSGDVGAEIAPPDGMQHVLGYHVFDRAGNIASGELTIPFDPSAPMTGNIAPYASPSASFTASWNTVSGLNDGTMAPGVADPALRGKEWGTWPQVGEISATLQWPQAVTVGSAAVWWFSDSPDEANAGMIPPREWKIQYQQGDQWVDVVLDPGQSYARERDVFNTVKFAPVTTSALRVVMQSWGAHEGEGSPGIWELQVMAAENQPTPSPAPQPNPSPDRPVPAPQPQPAPGSSPQSGEQVIASHEAPSALPHTGAQLAGMAIAALAVLLVGSGLCAVRIRRKVAMS